jgi:hypothetical protein
MWFKALKSVQGSNVIFTPVKYNYANLKSLSTNAKMAKQLNHVKGCCGTSHRLAISSNGVSKKVNKLMEASTGNE